jgi:hypothetical protein
VVPFGFSMWQAQNSSHENTIISIIILQGLGQRPVPVQKFNF